MENTNYQITIDLGHAAFADGEAPFEVARILKDLADHLENGGLSEKDLYDYNGNNVGEANIIRNQEDN